MIQKRRRCAAFVISLMTSACATTSPLVRQECYNPDAQLASLLQPLEELRAKGCVGPAAYGEFQTYLQMLLGFGFGIGVGIWVVGFGIWDLGFPMC